MSEISALSSVQALRVVRPVGRAESGTDMRRDGTSAPRQAYVKAAPRTERTDRTGDYAPFVAQTFANDNGATASAGQGAIAYLVTHYRLTDLPTGFLVAKVV